MFVQFVFINPGPGSGFERYAMLSCSLRHNLGGRRVNIKVLGEMYKTYANFGTPIGYFVTRGIGSTLNQRASTATKTDVQITASFPGNQLGTNSYPGGQLLWETQTISTGTTSTHFFENNESQFVHKDVLLVGSELRIELPALWTGAGLDRQWQTYYRVLYLDIEPVN